MLRFICKPCPIVVREFETREIRYAFHDIDGTHSLIRDWPPVMSIVLDYVSRGGVPDGYDSEENAKRIIALTGTKPLPDTDRFCVESAGLSALTQMEWAIRRAIDAGIENVPCDRADNRAKIAAISAGEEVFATPDTPELTAFLETHTPRLFKFYERVLNGYCRDRNLGIAKRDPDRFIVKGSMEFLKRLRDGGVKNYFVTGAVVERGMGMWEEVETLGFKTGRGEIVEDIIGSTWTEKLPKDVIMAKLLDTLGADGKNVLVAGDGRAEISAGAKMGALCISRLGINEDYKRSLHKRLGTHIIVSDFTDPDLATLIE
ncbi:MAG: HAD family hydrolase [Clostridia bacterium]|nr:HAD family hydrolase [Clostridia bacterium]